MEQSAISAFQS